MHAVYTATTIVNLNPVVFVEMIKIACRSVPRVAEAVREISVTEPA